MDSNRGRKVTDLISTYDSSVCSSREVVMEKRDLEIPTFAVLNNIFSASVDGVKRSPSTFRGVFSGP